MPKPADSWRRRAGRTWWAVTGFLLGFAVLLVVVSWWYLIPAADAVKVAEEEERQQLAAYSRLLLAIVLFCIFVGLLLTFRVGRWFFPRDDRRTAKTRYPDAWTESAKRMKIPPEEQEQ